MLCEATSSSWKDVYMTYCILEALPSLFLEASLLSILFQKRWRLSPPSSAALLDVNSALVRSVDYELHQKQAFTRAFITLMISDDFSHLFLSFQPG